MRAIGPWPEGTMVKNALYLLSKGEQQNEYIIHSVAEKDIESVLEKIPENIRIKKCTTHIVAISSIVGKLTNDVVMSCFLTNDLLEIIVSEEGLPYYSQISPLDTLTLDDPSIINQTILNVRQIVSSKLNKEVKKTIFFSRHIEEEKVSKLFSNDEIWKPDISHIIEEGQELFFKYPEFFGTLFIPKEFNLLPKHIRQNYLFQDINKTAAAFALVGTIALGLITPYTINKKRQAQAQYEQIYKRVKREKRELQKQLPSTDKTNQINKLLDIWNNIQKEQTLSSILIKISKALPNEVVVKEIKIARETSKQTQESPESGLEHSFIDEESQDNANSKNENTTIEPIDSQQNNTTNENMIMELSLFTNGEFQEIKDNFEKATIALGNYFNLQDIKWNYKEDKKSGILNCKIILEKENNNNETIL